MLTLLFSKNNNKDNYGANGAPSDLDTQKFIILYMHRYILPKV